MSPLTKYIFCVLSFASLLIAFSAVATPDNCDQAECDGNQVPIEEQPPEESVPEADLRLEKTVASPAKKYGDAVKYLLKVKNYGPDVAVNVIVSDSIRGGFDSATLPQGCSKQGNIIDCVLGDMPSGDERQLRLNMAPRASGTVYNTARVNSQTPDPYSGNNIVTASTVYPDEQFKCCTCIEPRNSDGVAPCALVAANRGCDQTEYANHTTTPYAQYGALMCDVKFQNSSCTSHELIINQHGVPSGSPGALAAAEFEAVLQGVKQNCQAGLEWCDGPFTYNGNFCFSAEAVNDILRICNTTRLPKGCEFTFDGNQSLCTWNENELHPYNSPTSIIYDGSGCKIEFPSCEAIDGKLCARDGGSITELDYYFTDEALCTAANGLTKTAKCQRGLNISKGYWEIVDE